MQPAGPRRDWSLSVLSGIGRAGFGRYSVLQLAGGRGHMAERDKQVLFLCVREVLGLGWNSTMFRLGLVTLDAQN